MSSETRNTTAQLQCMQKGGPFRLVDVPIPVLEPDQVLIRQRAIALNDLDRKQRDSGFLIDRWPHVLGIEGSGVVEAVGSDVISFQPGDEVLGWASGRAHGENWGGSYQERVVIPVSFVAKKPRNISIEDAASLP
jgi:NADPH:quinone reductase-like Zn-dependent oxidoreductase